MKLERNFDQISRLIRMDTRISADAEYVYGVLCFLSNYCSKDPSNRVVRVTVDNLCVWCKGKTKKVVNKAIKELIQYKYISKEKVKLSAYQMNQYTLLDPPEGDVEKMTFEQRKMMYKGNRARVADRMVEENDMMAKSTVVADVEIDEQFSNCIGTIERGTENQKEEAVVPSEETKAKNEVVDVFNYDQPFEFDENTEYWEKGLEHVDEKTFNNFLHRRFPKNENVFDAMIKRMKDDNKIGWQTYADGTSRYNVYQITKDEYDRYYNEAVSKCLMAVS